jgi:hypothetical protein
MGAVHTRRPEVDKQMQERPVRSAGALRGDGCQGVGAADDDTSSLDEEIKQILERDLD